MRLVSHTARIRINPEGQNPAQEAPGGQNPAQEAPGGQTPAQEAAGGSFLAISEPKPGNGPRKLPETPGNFLETSGSFLESSRKFPLNYHGTSLAFENALFMQASNSTVFHQ